MAPFDIGLAMSHAALKEPFAVRFDVFVREQAIDEAMKFDGWDDQSEHFLARIDRRPVGTLRLRLMVERRVAKVERVAVLKSQRGQACPR